MLSNAMPVRRYSAQAWLLAIGVSMFAVAVRTNSDAAGYGGIAALVLAALFAVRYWIEKSLALVQPAPRRHSLYRYAALILLWLWNASLIAPMSLIYVEPRFNRAYSEELGFEAGEALLLVLACNLAVTLIVLLAPRLAGSEASRRRLFVRALCAGVPVALAALAFAAYSFIPEMQSAWSALETDLPGPSLVLIESRPYWGILPLLALALGRYGIARPEDATRVNRALAGLLALLVFAGALLTFFVGAAYLPVYPSCGGPI